MKVARLLTLCTLLILSGTAFAQNGSWDYPETKKEVVFDDYHGVEIEDPYRWLEDGSDPAVQDWVQREEMFTHLLIDTLPQVDWLISRFEKLWRYDDRTIPHRVIDGERTYYKVQSKDEEKWKLVSKATPDAELEVLLDPNQWAELDQLADYTFSRDGRYLAYGVAQGGNEDPRIRILDLDTGELLPDTLNGWDQSINSWLPDGSGFYYSSNPLKGEVPDGEEYYWGRVWLHKLGTPASEDRIVWEDDEVKERWHWASVSEDGKYTVFFKGTYYAQELYIKRTGKKGDPKPLATGFDGEYSATVVDDKVLIETTVDAPRGMVYITKAKKPGKKYWKVLIPEHETDKLVGLSAIGGHIYAKYMHNAHTRIAIYDLKGNHIQDMKLPTMGTASVSGLWSQPEVIVSFSSFTYPRSYFTYDVESNSLVQFYQIPIDVNVDDFAAKQVWYPSKDGTEVSMFLVYKKGMEQNGKNPVFLTGYGGFNISMQPRFSSTNLTWVELGGIYALPNLRGGGEYGDEWHKAGMLENKQNVFDDFIAAAEYLIDEGYTSRDRLAISGGSNGGLLTGAALVQRPELFAAVEIAVPLLDMLRYHTNKYANVWSEEYGSSDDPEQFEYIRAYSPYHNITEGMTVPPTLVWASANDARVDAYHSRKMVARLQKQTDGGPVMYLERSGSGHHGGTTLSIQILHTAETRAFMMHFVGMDVPETKAKDDQE